MKNMNETKLLPDNRSELLHLAVVDFTSVTKDSRYVVDMGNWHRPIPQSDRCAVCLAGAVIAKTLGADAHTIVSPNKFDSDTLRKLMWLDDIRTNNPYDYTRNPLKFIRWLEDYANYLAAKEGKI